MRSGHNEDDEDDEGMGTTGEIRRKETEEAARRLEQEHERLREAQRQREDAERRRRDRRK